MIIKNRIISLLNIVLLFLALGFYMSCGKTKQYKTTKEYSSLISLFKEFRSIQKPPIIGYVPDYSHKSMNNQYKKLKLFYKGLASIDTIGWPIKDQVDYHLVLAEMNGLDFYHRVLRPWSRDPCFYSIRPGMTDPFEIEGILPDPQSFPLEGEALTNFIEKLKKVPQIYNQAINNLVNPAKDLAKLAIHFTTEDVKLLNDLQNNIKNYHPGLILEADNAIISVQNYLNWLINNEPLFDEPAGLGADDYNWWLKNVHLVPYTIDDIIDRIEMEDIRLYTMLKLEENRNKDLPELKPLKSYSEYRDLVRQAVDHLMSFIVSNQIFTIDKNLDIEKYWSARKSAFRTGNDEMGVPDYFSYYVQREPVPHEAHEGLGHDFEWQRLENDDREIRGIRRLFFIEWIRDEGWAFALEELLMHAGVLDNRPNKGREIVYKQAIFRNCRALMDLKMHNRILTLQEAMDFCVQCAPHSEYLDDSHHLWYEARTTLRIPGWHMGMVIGKVQIMNLFRDRAKQLGPDFNLQQFLDQFISTGFIPISLIRWEMTGLNDEIKLLNQ